MEISKDKFKEMFLDKLQSLYGVPINETSDRDKYTAVASVVKDIICRNWVGTHERHGKSFGRHVYYLSLEFLPGKFLGTNLLNLGLRDLCKEALKELQIDLESVEALEDEPGLGNGGLGRLAACFMDSMASWSLPCNGCGIRYKYGLFKQKIIEGYQVELPDNWLNYGSVWEIKKPEESTVIKFGGTVRADCSAGRLEFIHENYEAVLAIPYDVPVVGYKNDNVNTLRLWGAEALTNEFDFASFSRGEYQKAVEYKNSVEAISEVLYPEDNHREGKILRLKQQYFLVSAALQSMIKNYRKKSTSMNEIFQKVAVHINDTHPALAIPELMRILLDEEHMGWDEAWRVTTSTISYTNHTVLPEALEKWEVDIIRSLLPRIYMIIHEINERFCKELWTRYPEDWDRIRDMAIISHGYVRMAHLAIVGSYSVNGVAELHTEILRKQVMKNFFEYTPHKFNNKTNGISHRAWLLKANPELAQLITETIGEKWIKHPIELIELSKYLKDKVFLEKFLHCKRENKIKLAQYISEKHGIKVDTESICDIQIKRIHEYKRQLLNVFHILYLYNCLIDNPDFDILPRTFVFGGKAAPGYHMAKLIIKLINTVADVVNNDTRIKGKLKVIFLENYCVSLGERIFPAADISEQISTASKEASGTGNMKFMINGSVTIGTLDGANVEIQKRVGNDNFISFGLSADEVLNYYNNGGYSAWEIYNKDRRIKKVMDSLIEGFLPVGFSEFKPIYNSLLFHNDQYFILKDFSSYVKAQELINLRYKDRLNWANMCIANIAQAGIFSSDRTVCEYAAGIWKVRPIISQE